MFLGVPMYNLIRRVTRTELFDLTLWQYGWFPHCFCSQIDLFWTAPPFGRTL